MKAPDSSNFVARTTILRTIRMPSRGNEIFKLETDFRIRDLHPFHRKLP
jgi:hypothetical protein